MAQSQAELAPCMQQPGFTSVMLKSNVLLQSPVCQCGLLRRAYAC